MSSNVSDNASDDNGPNSPALGSTTVGGNATGSATIENTSATSLPERADELLAAGYRLALAAAHDDGDALRAVYLFTAPRPNRHIELHLPIDLAEPKVPTLADRSFPAGRFEREMHDLYGIIPVGHPLPRRLVRHQHWPAGWYPMRHNAGPPPQFGDTEKPFPFLTVEGPGVYEIPVGPVHAGLIEPGHFRFSVIGETILKLKARLWYVHRGVEKLFEGRTPVAGVALAERISGDSAVGHTLAYCQAVEDALGIEVPSDAVRIRVVLLELERLYNHIGDLGALCNDVGHGILNAQALRVRERLLQLNAHTTGHRLLRGGVHIGGSTLRATPDRQVLAEVLTEVHDLAELAQRNSLVLDRFTGTAILRKEQARDLGTLGYVARASGIDTDARRDDPAWAGLTIPIQDGGDVLARFQQRVAEIEASITLLSTLTPTVNVGRYIAVEGAGAPSTENGSTLTGRGDETATAGAGNVATLAADPGWGAPRTSGVGLAEGWRGTIAHRVELTPDGRLSRVKVVDPSFFNWPALPVALADTIVPDFPLANKSFNLSYAGNDL